MPASRKKKNPPPLKLAVIQMRCVASPEANQKHAEKKIRAAAKMGAGLVCLPELYRSLYFCQEENHAHFDLAETIPGPTTKRLGALARELGIVLVASLFERRAAGLYHNTAAILDADGKLLGKYRKMHIPDDPLYYEKFYFTPGDLGFRTWNTARGKIGVCICWDQWFPEAARLTAMSGAQILFYPTAIGWHPGEKAKHGVAQHASWETIQRSHAIANGCYVAVPNRVGLETPVGGDGIQFWGQSFVCDPQGQILAKAGSKEEDILCVDIDLRRVEEQRTHWPFLRDRRTDAYGDMTKRLID
jgi:N-carbamoylputrescine amidase